MKDLRPTSKTALLAIIRLVICDLRTQDATEKILFSKVSFYRNELACSASAFDRSHFKTTGEVGFFMYSCPIA